MRVNLSARLASLESRRRDVRPLICFADLGETTASAIARAWPMGVQAGRPVICFAWMAEEHEMGVRHVSQD